MQDGAPELWNLMTAACARRGITPAVDLIDRHHLDAHIAALLDLVAATDRRAEILGRRWAAALDSDLDLLNHALAWNSRARDSRARAAARLLRPMRFAAMDPQQPATRYAAAGRVGFSAAA